MSYTFPMNLWLVWLSNGRARLWPLLFFLATSRLPAPDTHWPPASLAPTLPMFVLSPPSSKLQPALFLSLSSCHWPSGAFLPQSAVSWSHGAAAVPTPALRPLGASQALLVAQPHTASFMAIQHWNRFLLSVEFLSWNEYTKIKVLWKKSHWLCSYDAVLTRRNFVSGTIHIYNRT